MYPHERSLVKKLEGKPFALLGVNTDSSIDVLKKVEKENQLTWRSWYDGQPGSGPICQKYGVTAFPTLYIIDHKGIVRYADIHGGQIDAAVDKLLKELENDKGKG
jgi:peroxiredoxin